VLLQGYEPYSVHSSLAADKKQSWCQVAAETMPPNSLIVGVDLAPIKPIPRTITFQSDITTDKCRATIRQHLKTWKADTVLHDGAPNVGTAWVQDAFTQAELALQAMKLATEFLVEGGTFVTKVFRSKDYNSLLWIFGQLFNKVEATKPPSSRNVSAEIFVVCRGFKAPKRIDPKFLDPRSVFAELADPTPNNEAKVYNPEKKKRKRDGYEEGNYTQFKEVPVSDFIQTTDPIAMLGSLNKLSFEQTSNGDIALAALDRLPETSEEIRQCCTDLKVLGRKDFKSLLRWRLKVRERFGLSSKKQKMEEQEASVEVAEVESMDEELQIQSDLQRLSEQESARKKRDRRRENERKQREIVRMQLHMTAPTEIGLTQNGPDGDSAMFNLRPVDRSSALEKVVKGEMSLPSDLEDIAGLTAENSDIEEDESDEEQDQLDRDLDSMYDLYQEKKAESSAKYRAKKARKERNGGDWEGFSETEEDSEEDGPRSEEDSSDDEFEATEGGLLSTLVRSTESQNGLTARANHFFDQDIFKDIGVLEDLSEPQVEVRKNAKKGRHTVMLDGDDTLAVGSNQLLDNISDDFESRMQVDTDEDQAFEIVKQKEEPAWDDDEIEQPNGRLG
jgi:AdoMet-dependent rRNA methyltransferase SPB1